MHQRPVVRRRSGHAPVSVGGSLSGGHVPVLAGQVHEQREGHVVRRPAVRTGTLHARSGVRGRRVRQDGQFVGLLRPRCGPSPVTSLNNNFPTTQHTRPTQTPTWRYSLNIIICNCIHRDSEVQNNNKNLYS